MAVSVRTRFEVFKRDGFGCKYCGRRSPEVVLEVDHIVPVCEGGTDDPINLTTSCWDCNRGKAGVPLAEVITGEDPHDRAVLLLERERQLREYNEVLAIVSERKHAAFDRLLELWTEGTQRYWSASDETWVMNQLDIVPETVLADAMRAAIRSNKTYGLGYVNASVKRWRERTEG
jgi:hypothetical protein